MHTYRFVICSLLLLLLAGCAPPAADAPVSPSVVPSATAAPTGAAATATAAPTATPAAIPTPEGCAETTGQVETAEIPSQVLPRPLQARVYLPPCYQAAGAQPYPLLVLLHGQGSDSSQWERLGVTQRAEALAARGLIPPLIIAMPYEQDNLADPNTVNFDAAVVDELLPWLAQEYNACGERDCRAVGGISRGAAWAVRAGLGHGQPFAAVGLHSLAPFYGDYNRLPYQAREIEPGRAPALWMDTGNRDRYLSQARHYHGLLEEYGVAHEFHLFAGEHDEVYWGRVLERYLRWYGHYLNRFLSPDPIVPSVGGGNNLNAVGYVANAYHSALTVDYHENQFLEQLNKENRRRLEDPKANLSSVPKNPIAFDRYAYTFNNPVNYTDPSGYIIVPILAGAVIGGLISTGIYAVAAYSSGNEMTWSGAAGAFAGGAVAGAVSVIAPPLAGTLLHAAGMAATGTALAAGTVAVNAAGGAAAYLAGGYTQNAVDSVMGNLTTFQPTVGGVVVNATVAGVLSPAVGVPFPVSANTMRTIPQALHFMPGRTVGTLFATQNARNMYAQAFSATGIGAFMGLKYSEVEAR